MIWIGTILCLIIVVYLYWRFIFFYRDPDRIIPKGKNLVAAADGTIVYVRKVELGEIPISIKKKKKIKLTELAPFRKEVFKGPQYIVGIFMHPTSIHVNRAPIKGRITLMKYVKSKNLPMTLMWWRVLLRLKPYEKYSPHVFTNERNVIQIQGEIPVTVVQIADIYVNKIVAFVKKKEIVEKGQRIGMIKMGSQVDMIFPYDPGIQIKIKEGQAVKAGASIIAEY